MDRVSALRFLGASMLLDYGSDGWTTGRKKISPVDLEQGVDIVPCI